METTEEEICNILEYFVRTTYRAKTADSMAKQLMQKCIELAKLDYNVTVLDNSNGDLCAHYPSHLIILESELNWSGEVIKDTIYEGIDSQKLRDLFHKARSARCRTRFPVPVIFYQGKYVCRSATLSGGPEIYGRSGLDYWFAGNETTSDTTVVEEDNNDASLSSNLNSNNWVLCDQVRKEDIKLLKALNVATIVDFMVEKKKVKFGMNVTSSEKVDKENRYAEFTIMSLPYPGCEFFRELRSRNYDASNLHYNWEQSHNDAELIMPQDSITDRVGVKWRDYKAWSLAKMTDNYLHVILKYLFDGSSGMLVHCISGWDRTPLFVSLIRILLWADGAIHRSLTPVQMLYFTISYDWLLFGHNFPDRWNKGEDIFFFCFDHLKNLMGDEFSVPRGRNKVSQPQAQAAQQPTATVVKPDEIMQCDSGDLDGGELSFNPQGSNASLNSSWSSISSKSQENNFPTADNVYCTLDDINNIGGGILMGDSMVTQRSYDSSSSGSTTTVIDVNEFIRTATTPVTTTSPVAVPSAPRTSMRHRNESSSSLSVGSWTYVTTTGSIRSNASSNSRSSGEQLMDSQNSAADVPDGISMIKRKHSIEHANCETSCALRRSRLESLRDAFVRCYRRSIGHNMPDGEAGHSVLRKMGNIFHS